MHIEGKTALVTGAGSGIGRATAIALARKGAAKILIADINEAGAAETQRAIVSLGTQSEIQRVDVGNVRALQGLFARVVEVGPLDVVVNNAGVNAGWGDIASHLDGRIETAIAVNFSAVVFGTYLAAQAMAHHGGGVVVNMSSGVALLPHFPDAVYAATKAAVLKFTECVGDLRASHAVRVHAVLPGLVDTPFLRGDRAPLPDRVRLLIASIPKCFPEEIADAVVAVVEDDGLAVAAVRVQPGKGMSAVTDDRQSV